MAAIRLAAELAVLARIDDLVKTRFGISGASSKSSRSSSLLAFSISILMFSLKSVRSTRNLRERQADSSFWNLRMVEDGIELEADLLVDLGDHLIQDRFGDLGDFPARFEQLGD